MKNWRRNKKHTMIIDYKFYLFFHFTSLLLGKGSMIAKIIVEF